MWRALYVGRNVATNALARVILPVLQPRGSLGMDGDLDAVAATLECLAPGLRALDVAVPSATVIELGPGRTPQLSAAFVLAGAGKVIALDTAVQVPEDADEPGRYRELVRRFGLGHSDQFLKAVGATRASTGDRLAGAAGSLPIHFERFDGKRMPIETNSVDLIVSKSVLEHVPLNAVPSLVDEMARVLRPDGGMVHIIDLRDHMHIRGDCEVIGDWLDALRYPHWLFNAMFSERSTAINRLRSPEWRSVLERSGFSIVLWTETAFPLPTQFNRRHLRKPWRSYDDATLATGFITVSARKTGGWASR